MGIKIYVSVCMGGLSVNINSNNSISMGVSRKEIFPLHSVSMVNDMFVPMEFDVSWKAETLSFAMFKNCRRRTFPKFWGERVNY